MNLINAESLINLALFLPVLILSLSIHEFAHAWSAYKLGDSTAKFLGRMTMDPTSHISVLGTIVFPAIAMLTGAPLFGWANPVPVDSRNFKKQRPYMAIVSFAGPLSNLIIAVLCTATFSLMVHFGTWHNGGVQAEGVRMLVMAIQLNVFLAFFNLIPIPPLDGAKVIQGFVKPAHAMWIDKYAPQGQLLLLVLFFTGLFKVLAIPVYGVITLLFAVFQIPMG